MGLKKKVVEEEVVSELKVPVTLEQVVAVLAAEESSGDPVVGGWMDRVERAVASLEG